MNDHRLKTRVLIADDENPARALIRYFLRNYESVEIVAECESGLELLQQLEGENVGIDLVFLDINMPGMSGVETLPYLKDFQTEIIFTTAHEEYAIDAFNFEAIDYLLKPYDQEKFDRSMERYSKRTKGISCGKGIDVLSRIPVRLGELTKFISVEDVHAFVGSGDYVTAQTDKGEFLVNQRLKDLEQRLPYETFLRIHRSNIVNLEKIESLQHIINGEYSIELKNGKFLKSSRSYCKTIQEILKLV